MATKQTITFRTNDSKRKNLDSLASSIGQDRSYLLNQAVDILLDVYNWQKEHIKKGQQQARNNQFVENWRDSFKQA